MGTRKLNRLRDLSSFAHRVEELDQALEGRTPLGLLLSDDPGSRKLGSRPWEETAVEGF